MFNKFALATAVALPLGMFALSGSAFADYVTKYYIPVQPMPSVHKTATAPVLHHTVYHGPMSCAAAGRMIRAEGYRDVKARNCGAKVFVFNATRDGRPVMLHFNPHNGHMTRA